MAARSGIGSFRVVASLPISVTGDPAAARGCIHARLGANDKLPSYRRVLERDRGDGISALSVVSSAAAVRDRLSALQDCGVTDFAAHVIGVTGPDIERTWELFTTRAEPPDWARRAWTTAP